MSNVVVDISLSAHELERAYQGVDTVVCHALDGRRIRFPVRILWQFIRRDGINGRFEIEFDENNKFKDVRQMI